MANPAGVPSRFSLRTNDQMKVVWSGILGPIFGAGAVRMAPSNTTIALAIAGIAAGLAAIQIQHLLERRLARGTAAPGGPSPDTAEGTGAVWTIGVALVLLGVWLNAAPAEPLAVQILFGVFIVATTLFLTIFVTAFDAPVPQLAIAGLVAGAGYNWYTGGAETLPLNVPIILGGGFVAGLTGFGLVQFFRTVTTTVRVRLPKGATPTGWARGELTLTWVARFENNNRLLLTRPFAVAFADRTESVTVTCSRNDLAPSLNYRLDAAILNDRGEAVLMTSRDAHVFRGDELIGKQVELSLVDVNAISV